MRMCSRQPARERERERDQVNRSDAIRDYYAITQDTIKQWQRPNKDNTHTHTHTTASHAATYATTFALKREHGTRACGVQGVGNAGSGAAEPHA